MAAMLAIEAQNVGAAVMDGYRHPWCPSGKLAWQSKAAAKTALRQIQSARRDTHAQRVYRCDCCDAFHTTSQTRREAGRLSA